MALHTRFKKEKRWICSCKRINDQEDSVCTFCQRTRDVTEQPKKITKKAVYDELYLWPVFSQFIRLRDSDSRGIGKCFTCGRPIHWKSADCGHGVGRQHKGTKYNEQNNHLQCKRCNGFEEGMKVEYKAEMDRRYGAGTWDRMRVASRRIAKLGKVECDTMITYYQGEIEKLLMSKKST